MSSLYLCVLFSFLASLFVFFCLFQFLSVSFNLTTRDFDEFFAGTAVKVRLLLTTNMVVCMVKSGGTFCIILQDGKPLPFVNLSVLWVELGAIKPSVKPCTEQKTGMSRGTNGTTEIECTEGVLCLC